jgi:hypothetical protein
MAIRLLALSDCKTRLGIAGSGDDTLLDAILVGVSARMERYCDRTFLKAAYTETVRPVGRLVSVAAYPIDTAQTITLLDDTSAVIAGDYSVTANAGLFLLKWRLFSYEHYASGTVTYTGGYAQAGSGTEQCLAVPDDLKDACAKQVKFEYQNRDQFGVASVSMQGTSVTPAPAKWLPLVEQVLWTYRRFTL